MLNPTTVSICNRYLFLTSNDEKEKKSEIQIFFPRKSKRGIRHIKRGIASYNKPKCLSSQVLFILNGATT